MKAFSRFFRQSRICLYAGKVKVSFCHSYLPKMKPFLWSRWQRTILWLPWFLASDIEMTYNFWHFLWILDNEDSHAKIEVESFPNEKLARPVESSGLTSWLKISKLVVTEELEFGCRESWFNFSERMKFLLASSIEKSIR